MVGVTLLGIIGTFLTSYTRARAESLGIDAKVGIMQRPERVTLLSAPQAFFGLVFNGWVLIAIVLLLSVTAWITAIQRIVFVHQATKGLPPEQLESNASNVALHARSVTAAGRRRRARSQDARRGCATLTRFHRPDPNRQEIS